MPKSLRPFPFLLLLGALALGASGCTKAAKLHRRERRADQAFAEGRFDAAEIDYLNALRIDGRDAPAIGRLGVIYFDEGRVAKALPLLAAAQAADPANLEVRLRRGLAFLAAGRSKDAAAEAEFLLDHNPGGAEAPLLLAEASPDAAARAAAGRRLDQLPAEVQGRAPVLTARAVLALREERTADAEALLGRALAADPRFTPALSAQAAIALARKDPAAAERAYRAASDAAPPRSPRKIQYAQYELQRGDAAAARAVLAPMAEATPDYLPALVLLAQLEASQRHPDQSAAWVQKVLDREPAYPEAVILEGDLLLQKGDAAKAVAALERARGSLPHSAPLEYELACAYEAQGDPAKAKSALRTALSWRSDFPEAGVMLADLDLRSGDAGGAVGALSAVVKAHPEEGAARYLLADAYLAQGDPDTALSIYGALAAASPRDPRPRQLAGLAQLRLGLRADARRSFEAALAAQPDYFPAIERLVFLDLDARDFAAAERRIHARIAAAPNVAEYYSLLVRSLLTRGADADAVAAAQTAIRLQPGAPLPYLLLAKLYLKQHRLDLAVANIKEAVARDPRDVDALRLEGEMETQAGDPQQARAAYERALALAPANGAVLNNLALLYADQLGDRTKALELGRRARQALPHDPEVADTLGWLAYRDRQYGWAQSLLQESAAAVPNDPSVQYHLAMAAYMLGDEATARAAFARSLAGDARFADRDAAVRHLAVLRLDPDAPKATDADLLEKQLAAEPGDPVALVRLAVVYQRAGRLDEAVATAERAVQANPKDAHAAIVLAGVYEAKGQPARAFEAAKSAHRLAPADPRVSAALGRLAFRLRDYSWALSLLKEASGALPDDRRLRLDLARAYYSVGDLEQAAEAADRSGSPEAAAFARVIALARDGTAAEPETARLEQRVAADPQDAPALMALAVAAEHRGKTAAAIRRFEAVLQIYPDFVPAERHLIILYAEDPTDVAGAVPLVAKVREALPDDPEVAKACGIVLYRHGDDRRALDLLRKSADQQPDDAESEFYVGMALRNLKDPTAKTHLQRALRLNLKANLAAQASQALTNYQ